MSGPDDPEVTAWLARLDTEAAVLPEDRRAELRGSVTEFLADAVRGADDQGRAARRALRELGSPAALVAEAGGYALPPVEALGPRTTTAASTAATALGSPASARASDSAADPDPETGPPRLEVGVLAALLTSVGLALVPATEAVAPLPWFVGTILVLLSRRWGAADKGLAVLAYGVFGVPFVLLGRDELPTGASAGVGVALVALWLGAALHLLRRARAPQEQGRGLRMR